GNSSDRGENNRLSARHRVGDNRGKNVTRAPFIGRRSEHKNVRITQRPENVILRLLSGKMNSFVQLVSHDARFQVRAQGAVADYFAYEIQCAILQLRTGINQNVETFERNQTTGAQNSDWAERILRCLGCGKTGEVNSVINAKNLVA